MDHLRTFDIHSPEFNEVRQVDLVEGLDEHCLEFVDREWTPLLNDCKGRALIAYLSLPDSDKTKEAWQEKLGKFGAPDAHWDWRAKHQEMLPAAHRIFALRDADSIEALMRIDLSRSSRIDVSSHNALAYVDYLAVAPWNRPPIQPERRFKGLGKLMLGVAVSLSMEEGMHGRCGLHSLPQSEGFYSGAGMDDLGPDGAMYGLRYFEFLPEAARLFLGD